MSTSATQPDAIEQEHRHGEAGKRGAGSRLRWPSDLCSLSFLAMSLIFGTLFALVTPPLWGLDEATHVSRAYAVAEGRILPQELQTERGGYGGPTPQPVQELFDHAASEFNNAPEYPAPTIQDAAAYERLASQPINSPEIPVEFSNTSTYSPVSYVPSSLALRSVAAADGSLGTALLLMRLANLLAYTGLTWLALRALRSSGFKWFVLTVALLPMTMFEAATITADTVTNGFAFLLSALFIKATFLRRDLNRAETGMLLASTVLLPLAKPTYVIIALVATFVPSARLRVPRWSKHATVGIGLAGFLCWTALSAQTSSAMHLMRPGETVDPVQQLAFIAHNPLEFLQVCFRTAVYLGNSYHDQFFGVFGSTFVPAPLPAVLGCTAAGFLAFGISETMRPDRWRSSITAGLVVLSGIALFLTLYMEYSPVGRYIIEGVQGRYFIPLVPLAAAVLLHAVPVRLAIPDVRTLRACEYTIVGLLGLGLLTSTTFYGYVLWH